jgi:REP element-mobilizing transposase RayT
MRKAQLEFDIDGFKKPGASFGGSRLKSHPKKHRPLDGKLPLHVMIKSSKAKGIQSMRHPKNHVHVNRTVDRIAKKYGIKIFRFVNVGNHLHMLIQIKKTVLWPRFIRELTGRLAQFLQDLAGQQTAESFWDHRPFTRVVAGWKKAFGIMKEYMYLNHLVAEGHINRQEMRNLKELRAFLSD